MPYINLTETAELVKELSLEDLETRVALLTQDLGGMHAEFNAHKALIDTLGSKDPSIVESAAWFGRLKSALYFKNQEHMQTMKELGERRRKTKREGQERMENRFVEISKNLLDEATFNDILDRAIRSSEV